MLSVRVEVGDPRGAAGEGELGAGLEGGALTPVDDVPQEPGRLGAGRLRGAVARTVVDDDHVGEGRSKSTQDVADHRLLVVERDHHPRSCADLPVP